MLNILTICRQFIQYKIRLCMDEVVLIEGWSRKKNEKQRMLNVDFSRFTG